MKPDAPIMASEATKEARMSLEDAWQRFAELDYNADQVRDRFGQQRKWILAGGVLATLLALFYEQVVNIAVVAIPGISPDVLTVNRVFRIIVIILPITVSALIAWSNKFTRGTNWILLRSSAEAVKHNIFLFRAKAGPYSDESSLLDEPREVKLARSIKTISERLMKTEVNQSGLKFYKGKLPPYGAEADDGFSFLNSKTYLEYRLEDQLGWYKRTTLKLDKRIRRLNIWILVFGAIGTLLAALEYEIWIAVTTAIVAAFSTYLEYNQLETTLTSYNQALTDLNGIRSWWRALPESEKLKASNFNCLVENAEKVMQAESNRWVQEMQDALSELFEEDQKTIAKLKEMATSVPKDITPEELAAAFGLEPGEYEVVEDELPSEIIEENTIQNTVSLAYSSPNDFYQTSRRETRKEEELDLPTAGLAPSNMSPDPLDPNRPDEGIFGDIAAEDNVGNEDFEDFLRDER